MITQIKNQITQILKGKVSILGIGNILKQDDGFGSILAKRLEGKLKNFNVLDLEDSPENFLGKILKAPPDTVLMIDCVSFGSRPGEVRLFDSDEIMAKNIFFTHNSSLSLLAGFIKENCGADTFLLGVQPQSIGFGEGLTHELTHALEDLEDLILNLDKERCATQYQEK